MINIIKPLRVLHIVGGVMDVGGIEMFLMNYYRHIDRDVIQFDFCIVEEGDGHFDHEIRSLGGELHNLPSKKRHPIKHFKGLLKVLKDYRNSPVHMHLDGMNGLYGLIALINGNQIRLSHSHSTNHLTRNPFRLIIHNFFRILNRLVNNRFSACSFSSSVWLHGKNQSKNAQIILNAINEEKFFYNKNFRYQLRKLYKINNEIVIGHIGRLRYEKNHKFMLRIARELSKKNVKFLMVFVGEGPLYKSIRKMAEIYNLSEKILLVGRTDSPEKFYNMFDIYIMPSIFEGLGMALIEAQTNGLNCYISDYIPSEAIFTNNVVRLPLNKPNLWVDNILANIDRDESKTENPYQIDKNAIILRDYYISITM
jgi:glycosyltransferase involved in cell wall biosynthesis